MPFASVFTLVARLTHEATTGVRVTRWAVTFVVAVLTCAAVLYRRTLISIRGSRTFTSVPTRAPGEISWVVTGWPYRPGQASLHAPAHTW